MSCPALLSPTKGFSQVWFQAIKFYCLGFLLVICFRISNNTEPIFRVKKRTLNAFCRTYSHAWNRKGCKLLWHTFTHFPTISLISCVDFFFFQITKTIHVLCGKSEKYYQIENKNHLNSTTTTLFKTTFLGFKSVSGWAQRHFWVR